MFRGLGVCCGVTSLAFYIPGFLAAILIVLAGCGGSATSAGNSPSNPSNPGTSAPGGTGGDGGGAPQPSTFVYVGSNMFGQTQSTFAFRLNADGTSTPVPGSPFNDPQKVFAQSGKFLVGHGPSSSFLTLYPVDVNTGAPQSAVSLSSSTSQAVVADAVNVYGGADSRTNGIEAFSVSDGKFAPVPGSPFELPPPSQLQPLFVTRSLLFSDRGSDPFAPGGGSGNYEDITVFSRSSTGALTHFASIGRGPLGYVAVVHPTAPFIYKLDVDTSASTLNVFSFDPTTGASALVQQMTFPENSVHSINAGAQGRFLFLTDQGLRVFSIDQKSGKLAEVAGSLSSTAMPRLGDLLLNPAATFCL